MTIRDIYGTPIAFPFYEPDDCHKYLGENLTDIIQIDRPNCIDYGYLAVGPADPLTGKRCVYGRDSEAKLAAVGYYEDIMNKSNAAMRSLGKE